MEKNVLLNCLSVGKSLIEANTAFYVKEEKAKSAKSKTDRYTQGKKLVRHYIGIERAPDGNAVVEFAVQSRSQSQMRHCFIDIIPKQANLFTLAQSTKKLADRVKLLQDADVKCFCSCPDFNWSGMKWKMKHQYDSLSAGHHSDAPKDDNGAPQQWGHATQMVSKVNATVNWATIGWMLLIGIGLTLLASLVAAVFVMRYEPLQILADRS